MIKRACRASTKKYLSLRATSVIVCALLCTGVLVVCWLMQHPLVQKAGIPSNMVFVQGGSLTNAGNGWITVRSFYIGKYEVTWAEWQTVRKWAATHGYDIGSVGDGSATNHPAHSVNWYDCLKWCNARSQMEGRTPVYTTGRVIYKSGQTEDIIVNASATGYRLPVSAEWEFAARGGTRSHGYEYSGGNNVNVVAWYEGNKFPTGTKAVGTKAWNELWLHDMSGNVEEWCFDKPPAYANAIRVTRGGYWYGNAHMCRAAGHRYATDPKSRYNYIGFRVILPPDQQLK